MEGGSQQHTLTEQLLAGAVAMPRGHWGAIWLLLTFARGGEPARRGGGGRGEIKPICTLNVQGETRCREARRADKGSEMWKNDTESGFTHIHKSK